MIIGKAGAVRRRGRAGGRQGEPREDEGRRRTGIRAGSAGLWVLVCVLGSGEADAQILRAQRAVEAPPPQFTSGPTEYGATVERTFSDIRTLQAFCSFYLGAPQPGAYYQACYIPALDTVVLPDARAWPGASERAQLREHEWAHARGWRHSVGLRVASKTPGR